MQLQIALGRQQLLYEQVARSVEDAVVLVDEFLADGTQQVRFTAAGFSESQHILAAIEKGALQQHVDVGVDFGGQTFAVETFERLLQRQPRGAQGTFNALVTTHVALPFGELEQELLVTQRLGACLLSHFSETGAHRGQAQLLETLVQEALAVAGAHTSTASSC